MFVVSTMHRKKKLLQSMCIIDARILAFCQGMTKEEQEELASQEPTREQLQGTPAFCFFLPQTLNLDPQGTLWCTCRAPLQMRG